jgi:hypothetical protein
VCSVASADADKDKYLWHFSSLSICKAHDGDREDSNRTVGLVVWGDARKLLE